MKLTLEQRASLVASKGIFLGGPIDIFEDAGRKTFMLMLDQGLMPENRVQYTLFDDPAKIEKMAKIYHGIDELSVRFGKHTVQHAASLPVTLQVQHEGGRGDTAERKTNLFSGENKRQRLGLPMLNVKV